jgi:hypothetical protein
LSSAKRPEQEKARSTARPRKVALVIAGMHRSGTSALTRVLNCLGCDLPKTLLPPSPNDNELGFWESRSIMELNEKILASVGSDWIDWTPLNRAWYGSPVAGAFFEQALGVLQSEFGNSRFFIMKDPRTCRLLPFWTEVIEAFGARPAIIVPIRNPLEVAASLNKRNGIDPSYAQLAWLRHVLEAEASSRHLPRVVTRYDDLLAGWQGATDHIAGRLGLFWPRRSLSAELEIDAFLSPRQRHNIESDKRLLEGSRLSVWIRETYEILLRWAREEVLETDMPALDRIRIAFDEATPAFERIVLATRDAARRIGTLESSLAKAQAELEKERAASAAERQKSAREVE